MQRVLLHEHVGACRCEHDGGGRMRPTSRAVGNAGQSAGRRSTLTTGPASISASTAAAAGAARPGTSSASARPTSSGGLVGGTARLQLADLGSPGCWASKATSIGPTSKAARQRRLRRRVCQTRNNWLGTARGRVGYAFDRVMPYITGGAAFGDIEVTQTGFRQQPIPVSAGRSAAASKPPSSAPGRAKVEYLYSISATSNCGAATCATPTDVDFTPQPRARRLQLPLLIAPPFGALTNEPRGGRFRGFHSRHPQPAVPFTTDGFLWCCRLAARAQRSR